MILIAESVNRWWIGICIPILVLSPLLLIFKHQLRTASMFMVFAFTWGVWNLHGINPEDLILETGHGTVPLLVKAVGRVTDIDPDRSRGSKSIFSISHLIDIHGIHRPCHGRLSWRIRRNHEFHEGDRVQLVAWIFPPGESKTLEPGDVDWSSIARHGGYRGHLVTPDPRLVHRIPESGVCGFLHSIRGSLRTRCAQVICRGLSLHHERTLLLGMTTGIRGPGWNHISEPFQRTGVAHVLAISGMHLGIIIGFVVWIGRLIGISQRVIGFSTIITTILYLTMVSWRTPIVRSAFMAVMISSGICLRRFPTATGFLFLAAFILLLHNPGSLFMPGFQLSFAVVLFILQGTRRVEKRWFTPPPGRSESTGRIITWLRTALVVSVVAWFTSIPIILHHFGCISPYAVPLSILLIPFLTLILALSFIRVVFSPLHIDHLIPPELIEPPLSSVIMLVNWFDSLPVSCIEVGATNPLVIPIGLSMVFLWIRFGLRESFWNIRHTIVRRSTRST